MNEQQARALKPGDRVTVNGCAATFVSWYTSRTMPFPYRLAGIRYDGRDGMCHVVTRAMEAVNAEAEEAK